MSPILRKLKGQQAAPAPVVLDGLVRAGAGLRGWRGWHFLSVCSASALALARVLCLAALVARLASAFALA